VSLNVTKKWWKRTSVVVFLMVIILFVQFSYVTLQKGEAIFVDQKIEKISLGGEPSDSVFFTPNDFLFEDALKISNTGLNSTHPRIEYYPETGLVGISWVDQVNPFTPGASSSINYAIGDTIDQWPSYTLVTTVLDTLIQGYSPAVDVNDTVHITYEKFTATKYDIKDLQLDNGTALQTEVNVATNAGNSTFPVSVFDNKGIVHLVWLDDTNNPLGDVFYTYFNTSTDIWTNPIVQVTTGAEIVATSAPSMAVDENNTVHLVWADKRSGDQEIYYSYLDEGSTWSAEVKLTNVPVNPTQPVVAFNNVSKELTMIYRDSGTTNNLYYIEGLAKSNVTTWTSPISLSDTLADSSDYDLCVDQLGTVIVVYEETINPNRIYMRQKSVSAVNFRQKQYISNPTYAAHNPTIAISEVDELFIAFTLKQGASTEVYLRSGFIDTDGDGLSDIDEVKIHGTDPTLLDTDGDTLSDGDELNVFGTNPLSIDSDSDLMPDNWEIANGLDPLIDDALDDEDEDDLTNYDEYLHGTNPNIEDTDTDTLSDGDEVHLYMTNPLEEDTDHDLLSDGYEVLWGLNPLVIDDVYADPDNDGLSTLDESYLWTDPTNPDTDGDGYSDGLEYVHDTDPLDPNDFPDLGSDKDYTDLIIAIVIGVVAFLVVLSLALLVARQFRPNKSTKRKELEFEERELFSSHTEKDGKVTWEEKERDNIETAAKKRFEEKLKTIEDDEKIVPPSEGQPTIAEKYDIPEPTFTTVKKEELDDSTLLKKRDDLNQIIGALEDYEKLLGDILKNKMTDHAVLTASREGLTEFAAESQSIYSEAKTLWDTTILPLIKGFEEPLYTETVKAEKIIDCCEEHNNKILEILVQRELDFTEEEERREDVKDLARKALEEKDSEEEGSSTDNVEDEKQD